MLGWSPFELCFRLVSHQDLIHRSIKLSSLSFTRYTILAGATRQQVGLGFYKPWRVLAFRVSLSCQLELVEFEVLKGGGLAVLPGLLVVVNEFAI